MRGARVAAAFLERDVARRVREPLPRSRRTAPHYKPHYAFEPAFWLTAIVVARRDRALAQARRQRRSTSTSARQRERRNAALSSPRDRALALDGRDGGILPTAMSPAERIAKTMRRERLVRDVDDVERFRRSARRRSSARFAAIRIASGCAEDRSRSGVISIVAWERPGPALVAFVVDGEGRVAERGGVLRSRCPMGRSCRRLRFAFFAELCASASMLAMLAGSVAVALLASRFVSRRRVGVVRACASSLARGRRSHGAPRGRPRDARSTRSTSAHAASSRRRNGSARFVSVSTLRVGISCSAPSASSSSCFAKAREAAFGILNVARRLPTRSSVAFLRGAYRIDEEAAKPALTASYIGAAIATVACALGDHRRGHRRRPHPLSFSAEDRKSLRARRGGSARKVGVAAHRAPVRRHPPRNERRASRGRSNKRPHPRPPRTSLPRSSRRRRRHPR